MEANQRHDVNFAQREKLPKSLPIESSIGTQKIPLRFKLDVSQSNERFINSLSPKDAANYTRMMRSPSKNHFSAQQITYRIVREKRLGWKGARTHFQLFSGGIPQFHAKVKTMNVGECIKISYGNNSHFSDKSFAGYLLVDEEFSNASLRINHQRGLEIFKLQLKHGINDRAPKTAEATIKFDDGSSFQYHSKAIELMPDGSVKSFDIPNVMTSIKNMVLEDPSNHSKICIGKVDKTSLQINADERVKPLICFSIGIVLFMCKY